MTIALGNLGPQLVVTAEEAGWTLRGRAALDLSKRSEWPRDQGGDASFGSLVLEVEQLLDLGLADTTDGAIVVSWTMFGDAIASDFASLLRGTEGSPFMLAIDRTDDLGSRDFRYRYAFRIGVQDTAVVRMGYFVEQVTTQRVFHLDSQTFALVEAMDRFNALPPEAKTKQESWLTFATVKGASASVGADLDATLAGNDVVIPSQIGLRLHVHSEDDSISFVPVSENLSDPGDAESFKRAFLRASTVAGMYSLDRPDGRVLRVVLTDRHRQVLERMKQVHRARGERRQHAERHPEQYFEGLLDAVDIRFWARVTGVGELPLQTMSRNPAAGGGFLDGAPEGELPAAADPRDRPTVLSIRTSDGEEVRIGFATAAELREARHAVTAAMERGEPTVEVHGHRVPATEELLEALAADPVDPETPVERGTHGGRRFLLIHTNEDQLWSPEGSNSAPELDEIAVRQWRSAWRPPSSLRAQLKRHQEEALRWLHTCDQLRPSRRGVLLADDMGLGKTLQILTHLASLIEQGRLNDRPDTDTAMGPWRPVLIVAPLILVENQTWLQEMERFFDAEGELFKPVLELHGAGINRVKAVQSESGARGPETVVGRPTLDATLLMRYRTVITNYETVVNYQHSLAQLKDGRPLWSLMVTDEAQKYKSPSTKVAYALKAIDCGFHIASTGTPVENRLLDLWNIMDTLQPAHLGTAQEFTREYESPAVPGEAGLVLEPLRQRLSYGRPHAFLLRRTKKEILPGDLPEKHILRLSCEMSVAEVRAHQELLGVLGVERRAGRHLAVLHRLQQLYQHPALLRDKSTRLNATDLLAESSKLRSVIDTLRQIRDAGEKAIIFARLLDVQQMLAQVIEHELGIRSPIINGATQQAKGYTSSSGNTGRARERRKQVLDSFREQPGFAVIILSPFVAGIGLTITEANHVIHYGRWWNPAVEAQATDRAYRIGQTRPVYVYLPVARDSSGVLTRSFDEALDALLTRKAELAHDFLRPADTEDSAAAELVDALMPDETSQEGGTGQAYSAETIDGLTPQDFEAVVAALFEAKGYATVLTATANDGGADVIAVKERRATIIQVKHSVSGRSVDVSAVSDLIGAIDVYRAHLSGVDLDAVLVTNSSLSTEARREARGMGVTVLEGGGLATQLQIHRIGLGAMTAAAGRRMRTFELGVRRVQELVTR